MLGSKEPVERDMLICHSSQEVGPNDYWEQIQNIAAMHQHSHIGINCTTCTWLGKEADGYGALRKECHMGELEVERVGTTGLGGSGLNWGSGVGTRTKAGIGFWREQEHCGRGDM